VTAGAANPLTRGADRIALWSAIAIGFSIPISVALDNILLALLVAGWVAGGAWAAKRDAVRANGVALAALVLLAVLAAGTLYGERYPGDALGYLGKYADLLAIPILVHVFRDARNREYALLALAAGLALTLVISYLVKFGMLPQVKPLAPDTLNPLAFKYKLTHNILMAFAAFLYAHLAVHAKTTAARRAWAALALLAVINVTFMVDGLTGQILLGIFVLYGGYLWKGWRGLVVTLSATVFAAILLVTASDTFRSRLDKLWPEFTEWRAGTVRENASAGIRLELYSVSVAIVREYPLLGTGTGGYPRAYAERAQGAAIKVSRNPHNEYLLIAVQTGLAGIAALLGLFFFQWRLAARLPAPESRLARGLVLAMVVGCLFNSMLLDHTEGLLYAWLTGVLYAGLPPRPAAAPTTGSA
jgi:O-antigen ligase